MEVQLTHGNFNVHILMPIVINVLHKSFLVQFSDVQFGDPWKASVSDEALMAFLSTLKQWIILE